MQWQKKITKRETEGSLIKKSHTENFTKVEHVQAESEANR